MGMISFDGLQILFATVFDIGDEVDLKKIISLVESDETPFHYVLKNPNRALSIAEAPLVVGMGQFNHHLQGKDYPIFCSIKIWNFGAASVLFRLPCQGLNLQSLKALSQEIENEGIFRREARSKLERLSQNIKSTIRGFNISEYFEEYTIYRCSKVLGISHVSQLFEENAFCTLILNEKDVALSQKVKDELQKQSIQYYENDLVVIDWNSAFVLDPDENSDIPDVLEFALCQSLEMRYYDRLLDRYLSSLQSSIAKKHPSIFSGTYSKLSLEAAKYYIEISDIVESVENSLKIMGEPYYARVLRLANERFRFKDWQQSVDTKLANLAEISKLLGSEISEKRSLLLEVIIVILITIEVVPFLWGLMK